MAYADYTFYTADFHGNKISETDYPYFAERASEYLDSLSFCRDRRDQPCQSLLCLCRDHVLRTAG